jgi:hypothetical protein
MRKIAIRTCMLVAALGILAAAPATMVENPGLGSKVNTMADSLPGSDYKALGKS